MAQLTYNTFSEWGIDIFCIEDYISYLKDNKIAVNYDQHLAGMVIFDDDNEETIQSFVDMCVFNKVSIFMIDFSNINDNKWLVTFTETYIKRAIKDFYIDLQSYEFRFAYGLKVE